MATTPIGGLPQTPGTQPRLDTGSQVMGKDDFLRLLVTQLSNQDPLNPMDGQQFAAQLAQFSSVEQLINIGDAVASQAELQELQALSTSNSIATGLIGKNIDAVDDRVQLTRPDPAGISFELPSDAAEVTVTIRNANGDVVRTLTSGALTSGPHEMQWDGHDTDGDRLPDGAYTFDVTAKDSAGNEVAGEPRIRGRVDRVSFGPDGAMLWVGGIPVPLAAVRSVAAPS